MDERQNLRFPIRHNGDEIWPEKQWQWSRERVEQALLNEELVFTAKADGWTVDYKQYLRNEGEVRGSKLYSILEGPYTQVGTAEIEELFGNGKIFPFPKPSGLIKRLLGCGAKDDIVLDFFSGSATTAHAVMALNAADGGSRRFIRAQAAEACAMPAALRQRPDSRLLQGRRTARPRASVERRAQPLPASSTRRACFDRRQHVHRDASVRHAAGRPAEPDGAAHPQGNLEQADCPEAVSEISDLIAAQRAYEMNGKVITAADQMLSATANMMR